jgi:hypothetical protein
MTAAGPAAPDARPIVFLHIPKTAGQTIHHALAVAVGGAARVSPVRTHTQAPPDAQFPPGYRLYSGHLDWVALDRVAPAPFVFTVLRDPRERIASFYFFLEAKARTLSEADLARPENTGLRRIGAVAADEYFFGGDRPWQGFIRDHYDNFYCTYFATRLIRGARLVEGLTPTAHVDAALAGIARVDRVYSVDALSRLEADFAALLGLRLEVADRYRNTGTLARGEARWPHLMARLERDASRAALERFVERDLAFLARLPAGA